VHDINEGTLTLVPGIRVGHHTHPSGTTGSTVIMGPPEGMVASGLALGGGPASREYALLDPARMMQRIDALLLCLTYCGFKYLVAVSRWEILRKRIVVRPAMPPVPQYTDAAIKALTQCYGRGQHI